MNILLIISLALFTANCTEDSDDKKASTKEQTAPPTEVGTTTADSSSLKIEDIKVGTGAEAKDGKKVTVHYTGTLLDGKKFDSSKDRGRPFPFDLGSGKVIKGWDLGVVGMKVGGIRKLTIPSPLAYKERGVPGVIPPDATLLFEIELLKVE